jgi:uncharacterized protein
VIDLAIEARGASIAASYTPADRATLVAFHGASEGTRDFELYEHLHRRLPTIGVGVVTYDRRGEGRSTGDPSVGRFDLQAEDALAVLHTLEGEHLVLWGYSQGSWIAPVVAVRDSRVECLVEIASTGVTPADQMLYGVAEHLRRAGYDRSAVDEASALRTAFHDAVHGRCSDESSVDEQLLSASRKPWWPLAYLPTKLPGPKERALWIEEMDYDPIPSFCAVDAPVLLFYGESDEWTPVARSAEAWSAAQGDNATITIVPGVGHDLRGPDGDVARPYDERLLSWLDATLPQ